MFTSPTSRFILRIVVTALLAGLASLKANITDGLTASEAVEVIYLTLAAGAAYAGIGAVTPVEPFIGVGKPEVVKVPDDPNVVKE